MNVAGNPTVEKSYQPSKALCKDEIYTFDFNFELKMCPVYKFQLAELHIYLIPRSAWERNRNLAEKSVANSCVSIGFVR